MMNCRFLLIFIGLVFSASLAHAGNLELPRGNPVYEKLLQDFKDDILTFGDFQLPHNAGVAPEVKSYVTRWQAWYEGGAHGDAPVLDYGNHHWVFNLGGEVGQSDPVSAIDLRDAAAVEELKIPFAIHQQPSSMEDPVGYAKGRIGEIAYELIAQDQVDPVAYGGDYASWAVRFLKKDEIAFHIPSPYEEWQITKYLVVGKWGKPQLVFLVPPLKEYVKHHLAMFEVAGAKHALAYLNQADREEYRDRFRDDFKALPADIQKKINGSWVVMGYQSTFSQKVEAEKTQHLVSNTQSGIINLTIFEVGDPKTSHFKRIISLESDATLWGEGTAFLAASVLPYHPAGILFFGSAGYLIRDQKVYDPHSPEKFMIRDPGDIHISNVIGPQTGIHLSIASPLEETLEQVTAWVNEGVTSIDCEQSRVAKAVYGYNDLNGTHIQFGATNLITDFPASNQYPADPRYNLDHIDPELKNAARNSIVDEALQFIEKNSCVTDMHTLK